MTDASRPATGYPAQPHNGYPPQSNHYYPNPNPNHNPYYPQPPYPSQRATFFRRFFASFVAVIIIFGTILFIIWLVLRPRVPSFTLDSLSLSSFTANSSSSLISGNFDLRFTVVNPNHKLHVYYDQVDARLFYKSSLIVLNELPPFDQGTKSQMSLEAKLVATSTFLKGNLIGDIRGDLSRGSVNFDVQVLAIVRFKAGGWRARRRYLRVFCDDLPVAMKSNGSGTLTAGPRRCAVGI